MRFPLAVLVAAAHLLVVGAVEHPVARAGHVVVRSPQLGSLLGLLDGPDLTNPPNIPGDIDDGKGDTNTTTGDNAPTNDDPIVTTPITPPNLPTPTLNETTSSSSLASPTTSSTDGGLLGGIVGAGTGVLGGATSGLGDVTSAVGNIGNGVTSAVGGITSILPPTSTVLPTTDTQTPNATATNTDTNTATATITGSPTITNTATETETNTDPGTDSNTDTVTTTKGGIIPTLTSVLGPILTPILPPPATNTTSAQETDTVPDTPTTPTPTVTTSDGGGIISTVISIVTSAVPVPTDLPTVTDTNTDTNTITSDTGVPPPNTDTDTTTPTLTNTDTTTPTATNTDTGVTNTATDTNTATITFPTNGTDTATATNGGDSTTTDSTSTSTTISVAPGLSFILTETTLALASMPTTTTQDQTLTDPDQATTSVDPTILSVASAAPTLTIAPLPTGIPNRILPRDQAPYSPSELVGFTLVSILFNQQLNWPFVVGNSLASSQILGLVPVLISSALGIDQSQIKTFCLQVFFPTSYHGPEDQDQLGTIWLGYIPSDRVDDLSAAIKAKQSKFYTGAPDAIARDLANRVQSGYPLLSVTDPNIGSSSNGGVGAGGVTSAVGDDGKSRQDAIIGVVTALGAIALMVLVFLVYRSMKRKRQLAHRRLSDPPDTTFVGVRPEGREFDQDSVGGQRRRSFYYAEDSLRGYQAENNFTTDDFDHTTPFRASVMQGQGQMSQRRNAGPVAISAPILRESSMNW